MAGVVEARNGRSQNRSKKENSSSMYKKPRKAIIESDDDDKVPSKILDLYPTLNSGTITYTMDTDISQLEAPTFTTLDRGPSKTMLNLQWDHPVNLIGKKVVNPMIHCCDTCLRPVLIYGRMIPCKHVFCLTCASTQASKCSRCGDKVTRVEPVGLGAIYMCSQGGTRYGNSGCKRTYLSQRDLQAHVQHRHMKGVAPTASTAVSIADPATTMTTTTKEPKTASQASVNYSESMSSVQEVYRTSGGVRPSGGYPPTAAQAYGHPPPSHISVIGGGTRASNLITVPIQDTSSRRDTPVSQAPVAGHTYPYGPVTTSNANYSQPPPVVTSQHFFSNPTSTGFGENVQNPQYRTNQSNFYRR